MGYYQDKRNAVNDIIRDINDKIPMEQIYYKIMVRYGFGKNMVDNVVKTTQEFVNMAKK